MEKTNHMQWTLVRSPALISQMEGRTIGKSSISEEDFHLSLHGSQDSDSDSLVQEMKYQSDLQHRISENYELVHKGSGRRDHAVNVAEKTKELKDASAKGTKKDALQNGSVRGRYQHLDQYADLRYDPNWKRKPTDFEKVRGSFQEDSLQYSDEEMPSNDLEERNFVPNSPTFQTFPIPGKQITLKGNRDPTQIVSQGSDSASSHSTKSSLNERLNVASNKYFSLHEPSLNGKTPLINSQRLQAHDLPTSNGFFLKEFEESSEESSIGSGDVYQNGGSDGMSSYRKRQSQKQGKRQLLSKKDFIEKNKVTLGKATQKQDSYLQLLSKKKGDINQDEIPDVAEVSDDAPTWIVIEDQQTDLDPEDLWQQRAQKLKEHKKKDLESNQKKSNKLFQEKSSKSQVVQRSSEKAHELTKIKGQKRLMGKITIAQTKPLDPEKPYSEEKSISTPCLSLNSDVYETPPEYNRKAMVKVLPQINPSDVKTHKPEQYPEMSSMMHFKDLPEGYGYFPGSYPYSFVGLPPSNLYDPRHMVNNLNQNVVIYSARDLHPVNNLQYLLQNRTAGMEIKNKFHSLENLSVPNMGHPTQVVHFQNAESLYGNPVLPPILPRVESELLINMESNNQHQATLARSNSEGYLLQMEKQRQHQEKIKTVTRTKGFMNKDIKLGGLGPDYQAIKDKAEQLKQQKEYAKKVKEQNKKNTTNTSKAQTKPPVPEEKKTSLSRHKAMEYAKKIPKPKPPSSVRSPDQESTEDMLTHMHGNVLPQMTLLEELRLRHEKEKQAVAAFRALHII